MPRSLLNAAAVDISSSTRRESHLGDSKLDIQKRHGRARCTITKLVRLTPELAEELRLLSEAWGVGGNDLIRRFVHQAFLARQQGAPAPAALPKPPKPQRETEEERQARIARRHQPRPRARTFGVLGELRARKAGAA